MSHVWMSHVTRVNESCHTCEWVMSHVWMSHVTQMHLCRLVDKVMQVLLRMYTWCPQKPQFCWWSAATIYIALFRRLTPSGSVCVAWRVDQCDVYEIVLSAIKLWFCVCCITHLYMCGITLTFWFCGCGTTLTLRMSDKVIVITDMNECLLSMTHSYVWPQMSDMTQSHARDKTHWYEWQDSFICANGMTHSCAWSDTYIRVTHHAAVCVAYLHVVP